MNTIYSTEKGIVDSKERELKMKNDVLSLRCSLVEKEKNQTMLEMNEQIEKMKEKNDQLESTVDEQEYAIQNIQQSNKAKDREIEDLQRTKDNLESEVENLKLKENQLQKKIKELQNTIAQNEGKQKAQTDEISTLRIQLMKVQSRLTEAEIEIKRFNEEKTEQTKILRKMADNIQEIKEQNKTIQNQSRQVLAQNRILMESVRSERGGNSAAMNFKRINTVQLSLDNPNGRLVSIFPNHSAPSTDRRRQQFRYFAGTRKFSSKK